MRPVGVLVSATLQASLQAAFAFGDCGDTEHYGSSNGSCIHIPYGKDVKVPNETATYRDGTYRISHHH